MENAAPLMAAPGHAGPGLKAGDVDAPVERTDDDADCTPESAGLSAPSMERTARSVSESLRLGGRPTFLAELLPPLPAPALVRVGVGTKTALRATARGVRLGRLAGPSSNDVSLLSNGQRPPEANRENSR